MDGNVTQNQIIKFVYGELSFEATARLYHEIDSDPQHLTDLETFAALKMEIDSLALTPGFDVRQNILEYSKSFED